LFQLKNIAIKATAHQAKQSTEGRVNARTTLHQGNTSRALNRARVGFSMLEVLVVVVILAILATVVVPRLSALTQRPARSAAIRVGDFLTAAAQRDALTSQPLAIEYDGDEGFMYLLVPGAEPGSWSRDKVIQPADFGNANIVEATADGAMLERGHFRLEFRAGVTRPAILVSISDDRDPEGLAPYRVELSAEASRSVVVGVGAELEYTTIDLDAQGKGDEPW